MSHPDRTDIGTPAKAPVAAASIMIISGCVADPRTSEQEKREREKDAGSDGRAVTDALTHLTYIFGSTHTYTHSRRRQRYTHIMVIM